MKIERSKITYLIPFYIVFFVWIYYVSREESRQQSLTRVFSNQECIGVVLEKYVDIGNHGYKSYRFPNGKCTLHHYTLMDSLYNMTEINDSIRKVEGDSLLYLIKEDTVYVFNFMDMVRAAYPDE
jgi:hypothetical protein